MNAPSKYTITRDEHGFTVSAPDRITTRVIAEPTGFEIKADRTHNNGRKFGLFEYYALSDCIAECLMDEWKSPKRPTDQEYDPVWVTRWAKRQTARTINKRVHVEWQYFLEQTDPQIRELQKRLFAVARRCPQIARDPKLYKNPIVKDAMKYRAAAIAIAIAGELEDGYLKARVKRLEKTAPFKQLQTLLPGVHLTYDRYHNQVEVWDLLLDWRALFSDTGAPYRSLDRTLMNLPGGVPVKLLANLNQIHLQRPVIDRLELTTLLAGDSKPNNNVWYHARHGQIVRAMQRVSDHLHEKLSPNRGADIMKFVNFVRDGEPANYTGSVVGLADRAIEYHRYRLAEVRERTIENFGGDTPTAQPPAPLPALPGVTFLDSVTRIVEEGTLMNNCVASYTEKAIKGWCYLFHAERAGEHATIEVNHHGGVVQSHGPSNRTNKTAQWAKRALNQWGKQIAALPQLPEPAELAGEFPF